MATQSIHIDLNRNGRVDFVGRVGAFTPEEGEGVLAAQSSRTVFRYPALPPDTVMGCAATAGGGTWAGCVYDPAIMAMLGRTPRWRSRLFEELLTHLSRRLAG
jgi:hypothetical protein